MNVLTKRIPTIVGLLLLVAAIGSGIYFFQQNNAAPTAGIVPKNIKITNISDSKVSVSWTTETATTGALEYGSVGDKLTNKMSDERDTAAQVGTYQTHHVTLIGLQPSTQYAFRILTGTKPTRFDNNGSPYTTTTGPVIGATPTSVNFYGTVELPSKQSSEGALVYVTLPGGAPTSTLVHSGGTYAVTISTMRTTDLRTYLTYDPLTTVATVEVDNGQEHSTATVALTNSAPVPLITLGQNPDYRAQVEQTPNVAQVEPVASASAVPETPSVFLVEPLTSPTDTPAIDVVSTSTLILLNPKTTGETLSTLRPEFRGTGPQGIMLSIALTGKKATSGTTTVLSDGTWSWSPTTDLAVGNETITISYVGTGGTTQKVTRAFVVAKPISAVDPAFVSTPSASLTPSTTPTPRAAMPATDAGVPVTGIIAPTLLTAGASLVIMVVGAFLLAL